MSANGLVKSLRTSITRGRRFVILIIGSAVLSLGMGMEAATAETTSSSPEYALKAAFLYNFALFTAWPDRPEKQLRLCVLGRDPFGTALDALGGKEVNGTRIAVLRLRSPKEAASACQIIFVTDADVDAFIAHTAEHSPAKGMLTIAEKEGAARAGIMIELVAENGKVVFEFNQTSAEKSGVSISSKLLRLARKIY
jgi:hypothetical protein